MSNCSFKGKGGEKGDKDRDADLAPDLAELDLLCHVDLSSRLPLSVASARSEMLIRRDARERIRQAADDLIDWFDSQQPDSPVYLVKSPDRANTYLRWRFRELMDRRRTELSSDTVIRVLTSLTSSDVNSFLDAEFVRLQLNQFFSINTYALDRLRDFVIHSETLSSLRRRFTETKSAP